MKAAGMFPAVSHTVIVYESHLVTVIVKASGFRRKEGGIMHYVVSCSTLKVLKEGKGAHDIASKKRPGTGKDSIVWQVKDPKEHARKKGLRERAVKKEIKCLKMKAKCVKCRMKEGNEKRLFPRPHCCIELLHKDLLECIEFIEWIAEMEMCRKTTISAFHG